MPADLVDGDDAGVAELGGGSGLADEPLGLLLAGEVSAVGDLDGHQAIELGIAGAPDGAEGPGADLVDQLELSEPAVLDDLGARPLLVEAEGGAAGGAEDLALGVLRRIEGVLAVGAEDLHGPALRRGGAAALDILGTWETTPADDQRSPKEVRTNGHLCPQDPPYADPLAGGK